MLFAVDPLNVATPSFGLNQLMPSAATAMSRDVSADDDR